MSESPGEADEGGGGDALAVAVAGLCGDEGLEGVGVCGAGRVAGPNALRRATGYVSAGGAGCDASDAGGARTAMLFLRSVWTKAKTPLPRRSGSRERGGAGEEDRGSADRDG